MTQGARLEGVPPEGIGRNRGERSWRCGFANAVRHVAGAPTPAKAPQTAAERATAPAPTKSAKPAPAKAAANAAAKAPHGGDAGGGEIDARQAGRQASRNGARRGHVTAVAPEVCSADGTGGSAASDP